MLHHLGNPAALRRANTGLMFAVDRGRPAGEYPSNWLHCVLPAPLVLNKPLALRLRVGEDLGQSPAGTRLTIQVEIDQLQADDRLLLSLGERSISDWKPAGKNRLEASIESQDVQRGENRIRLELKRQAASSNQPRIARAVELHVTGKK